jgi:hypothetical protein
VHKERETTVGYGFLIIVLAIASNTNISASSVPSDALKVSLYLQWRGE